MYSRFFMSAAAGAVVLFGASAALAKAAPSQYVMEYSGTVSGSDPLDLFGGGNLDGDTYTEIFTANASAFSTSGCSSGVTLCTSQSSDPFTSAELEITTSAGKTYDFSFNPSAGASYLADDRNYGAIYDGATGASCTGSGYNRVCTDYSLAGGMQDKTSGASYPSNLINNWNITAKAGSVDLDSGFVVSSSSGWVEESLCLDPIAAVPEPSAWALMISGVAMVGAMLRFRRRGALAAA